MTEGAAQPTDDERRARGAEIVARVRFARWSRRATSLGEIAVALAFITVPVCVGLAVRFEPRHVLSGKVGDSALAVAGVTILLGFFILSALGTMLLLLSTAPTVAFTLADGIVRGPWHLIRARARRDLEEQLLRGGEPGADWVRGRAWRRRVLEELADEDDALRVEDGTLRVAPLAIPLRCPSCGASLRAVGAGVRRCGHCAYERYDALPGTPGTLARATKQVRGADVAKSRKALIFRLLRENADDGLQLLRVGALTCAGLAALCGVSDLVSLATGKSMHVVAGLALAAVVLAMLPICYLLGYGGYLFFRALFDLRKSVRVWDEALGLAVVGVVTQQGCIPIVDLARHLGTSEGVLRSCLARLDGYGGLPLYRDREAGRLFALPVVDTASNACPACGGRLVVVARARQRCEHCGGYSLGRT